MKTKNGGRIDLARGRRYKRASREQKLAALQLTGNQLDGSLRRGHAWLFHFAIEFVPSFARGWRIPVGDFVLFCISATLSLDTTWG